MKKNKIIKIYFIIYFTGLICLSIGYFIWSKDLSHYKDVLKHLGISILFFSFGFMIQVFAKAAVKDFSIIFELFMIIGGILIIIFCRSKNPEYIYIIQCGLSLIASVFIHAEYADDTKD